MFLPGGETISHLVARADQANKCSTPILVIVCYAGLAIIVFVDLVGIVWTFKLNKRLENVQRERLELQFERDRPWMTEKQRRRAAAQGASAYVNGDPYRRYSRDGVGIRFGS